MNTIPDFSFEEHINRLISSISIYDKNIKNLKLKFYYRKNIDRIGNKNIIKTNNLLTIDEFKEIFINLCSEGREWIHLMADGRIDSENYAIKYDFSNLKGKNKTAINIAGPLIDLNGNTIHESNIELI
jgi:hypothetical protein